MTRPVETPYVFLSYSRQDATTVDRIADALAERGIRVWRDIHDIQPGEDWVAAINQAIDAAAAALLIASRNSVRSKFIFNKLGLFLQRKGGRVIPVSIDETPIDEFPSYLRDYQFVRLDVDFQSGIERLVGALERWGLKATARRVEQSDRINKGYVFVSYAKEDQHYVATVTAFFKDKGYAYFDYKDRARQLEADFDVELEERLHSAALVTAIVTPRWKKAVWPKKEYLFASRIGVPTFLLMFEDPGPSILIIDRTPIDFTTDKALAFATLDEELRRRRL